MKARILLTTLLSFAFYLLSSQVPQGFNYQAIARDGSGNPIVNATIDIRLSVLSDSNGFYPIGNGTYVWEETHSNVKTNNYGLFNIVLGNPLAVKFQGAVASFSDINWSPIPLYIGTKVYYQSSWKPMGAAQLWTVPYSMVAGDLSGAVKKLAVTGTTANMDEALFEVKNKNGQTVFAVYNEGVRVYVDDGITKGLKGGFAIGGFGTGKAASQPYFVVNPDSIRAYIAPGVAKGQKGGFAIGGFDPAKAVAGEEYLRITRDSSRIYVKEPAKGQKGGFAIGSFNPAKGQPNNFMDMTSKNYFIGDSSGVKITTGLYNSFIGYKAGVNTSTGNKNAFFGYQSGYQNVKGDSNLFVGYQSGFKNIDGSLNSFVGYKAGYSNTTGKYNTFLGSYSSPNNSTGNSNTTVGYLAGYSNLTGNENSFIGYNAGYNNRTGTKNVYVGPESGYHSITGNGNVFTGVQTGYNLSFGDSNIFVGTHAGYTFMSGSRNICIGTDAGGIYYIYGSGGGSNTNSSDNIFIGHRAGIHSRSIEITALGDGNIWIGKNAGFMLKKQLDYLNFKLGLPSVPITNTLVIDNRDQAEWYPTPDFTPDVSSYPLIFGSFSTGLTTRCVVINGVNNHGYTFFVNGSHASYGAWGVSDEREKKNIQSIPDALSKVMNLRGVNFEWKDTLRLDGGKQMGFIAQEAIKVVPEIVRYQNDFYTMNYSSVTALLTEAVKEQQSIIELQKSAMIEQEKQIQSLQARIEQIESLLTKSGMK